MNSTLIPNPNPSPNHQPSLSVKSSPRKLPVKRKNPNFNPNPNPKFEPLTPTDAHDDAGDSSDCDGGDGGKPPPFKFHRIWTEADEIRFLQGLLNSHGDGLSFPRDLHIFYSRFSGTMPQPYTRSQLSEKLRRLRKKFRVIASRLSRGLAPDRLSPHDRELFELSKKLWDPEHASASPFMTAVNGGLGSGSGGGGASKKSKHENLVGVEVSFSPTLPFASNDAYVSNDNSSEYEQNVVNFDTNDCFIGECGVSGSHIVDDGGEIDASEANCVGNGVCFDLNATEVSLGVNIGVEEEVGVSSGDSVGGGLGRVATRAALDVFDESFKEARGVLVRRCLLYSDYNISSKSSFKQGKSVDFEKLWQEQQVAEFDVLARRLRLVLENNLSRQ